MTFKLFSLYKDWLEVYQLTGYGKYELSALSYMLGLSNSINFKDLK